MNKSKNYQEIICEIKIFIDTADLLKALKNTLILIYNIKID